jgi:hypothetical protein
LQAVVVVARVFTEQVVVVPEELFSKETTQ